jgi:hypothetical protein
MGEPHAWRTSPGDEPMKRLLLFALLLFLGSLVVPGVQEHTRPRVNGALSWAGARLEGPASPLTNRYRRIRAEAELDRTLRRLVMDRNQGMRLPEPTRLANYMTRHDIAQDGIDPWGTPYLMVVETDSIALVSAGPDHRYDTDDDLVVRFARPPGAARR